MYGELSILREPKINCLLQNTEFQYILDFSMSTVRFVKSFSKGQITIPKEFRNAFGIRNEFWLKLYIESGKLIAEPVEKERNQSDYLKKLLAIKGGWISEDEIKKNRAAVEKQLKKQTL